MNERKKSDACVTDPFDRAKGSLKRLDTFAIPGRVQAAGCIHPLQMCADVPGFVNLSYHPTFDGIDRRESDKIATPINAISPKPIALIA
jgi:hypothetical protein